MSWYLQSKADHDTHQGELGADGIVTASCGVKFPPLRLPFDRVALPRYPQDRDQICPECERLRRERGAR